MKLKRIYLFLIPIIMLALTACAVETEERAYSDEDAERVTTVMVDLWNTGNTDLADSIYTDKSVRNQVGTRMFNGPAEIKEFVTSNRTSYPDFKVEPGEIIYGEEKIVMKWTVTGTNTGDTDELKATGKAIKVDGVSILTLEDGMVINEDVYFNQLPIYESLGFAITPPVEVEGEVIDDDVPEEMEENME